MPQTIPLGFERPVFESQSTFRSVLTAMSSPGRPVTLPVRAHGPEGWTGGMAALVLTLCDMDTPLWLDHPAATPEALRFLRFHCGSPLALDPGQAAFVVAMDPCAMPPFCAFAPGSAEFPEKSATILLASDLDQTGAPELRLRGPGVKDSLLVPSAWLPGGFARSWQDNRALFPQGVDVILVGRETIVGLPRTTRLEEAACM